MVNIAIIGLGYWGPNYARIVSEHKNASLVWFCDISKKNLEEIKRRFKTVKTTTRLEDVLNDKEVDALIIAVPAAKHYEVAKKALLADKDVLIEKPLAINVRDAKHLIKLARETGRILMVDHIFLFNPGVRKVKELIDKGKLGKIYYGHATYTALGPIRVDVSSLWDLAIHFVYTIIYLLGQHPTSISAFGKAFLQKDNADVAFINLEFGKRIVFNLKVSWLEPVKTRQLVLMGDKRMISFDDNQIDKVTLYDRGARRSTAKGPVPSRFTLKYGDVVLPNIVNKEPLREVVEHFIWCFKTQKQPLVNPLDSVNSIVMLEAAEYSLHHKSVKVIVRNSKKTGLLSFRRGGKS